MRRRVTPQTAPAADPDGASTMALPPVRAVPIRRFAWRGVALPQIAQVMPERRPTAASIHLKQSGNRSAHDDLTTVLRTHARAKDLVPYVGDGWLALVRACHEAVVAEFPNYELLAIKQKYGELAFQAFPTPVSYTHLTLPTTPYV